MSTQVGYSVVALATGQEVAITKRLPARLTIPNVGVSNFDKPGQVVPSSVDPTHKLVERWADEPPSRFHRLVSEAPVFDGTKVHVTRAFDVPDLPGAVAEAKASIKASANARILAVVPDWKQRNLLAQGTLLLHKGQTNWTSEDQVAWTAGEALWAFVAAVRAHSDALEAEIDALVSTGSDDAKATALAAWREHNWPEHEG